MASFNLIRWANEMGHPYRVGCLSKRKLIPINKRLLPIKKTLIRIKKKIPSTPLVLACWFPDRLVLCSLCPGPLVPWSLVPPGPLVLWSLGPVVLWSLGRLVPWSLVPWSSSFWSSGPLVFGSLGLHVRGKTRSR